MALTLNNPISRLITVKDVGQRVNYKDLSKIHENINRVYPNHPE